MLDFIIKNYILIVLFVGTMVLLHSSLKTLDEIKRKRIREMLVVITFLAVSSAFKVYYSTLDYYHIGITISSFFCYTLRPAVIILFTSIISKNKPIKYLGLLCLINSFIYIIGLYNGITFTYTQDNILIRGPLAYTSHIFCLFYFIVLIYTIIKQHGRNNKMRTILMFSIMITCGLASFFDVIYDDVNLLDICIVISGLEYYLYLYMEHNKIDVLTGAFNRASFYNDIDKLSNKVTSVISIDMNDLKKINDTLGHDEGDKAIIAISKVLLNVDDNNVRIYRIGGDEFAALCFYKVKENVENFIKKAKKELNKTKYNCSFGYSYKDTSDLYETYKKADNEMYKEKEKYHKKNGRYR